MNLPEGEDLGAAVDTAMKAVETHNPELRDVLPKGYQRLEKSTLVEAAPIRPAATQPFRGRVRADLRTSIPTLAWLRCERGVCAK